jgi:hypothetical protein
VCYITIFAFTGRIFFFGTSFENAGVGSETEAVLHFAWDLLPLLDTTVALFRVLIVLSRQKNKHSNKVTVLFNCGARF